VEIERGVSTLTLTETNDLEYPDSIREAIESLEIKEGWTCGENECMVCGTSEKYIENHCRLVHGKEAVQAKAWYKCRMQTLLGHPHIRSVLIR
jgi:hypothetical protein